MDGRIGPPGMTVILGRLRDAALLYSLAKEISALIRSDEIGRMGHIQRERMHWDWTGWGGALIWSSVNGLAYNGHTAYARDGARGTRGIISI